VGAHALLRLSEKRRLLVQENSDGVTPGEAAAALVLSAHKQGALAAVLGLGVGHEASSLENDVPMRGEGITAAARAALAEAGLAFHDMDFRISDAAGETFFFKEQILLISKLLRAQKEEFPLWLAAESIGDSGAAAGVCGLSYALGAFARGRAPGRRVIAFAGNEKGQRGALVMEDLAPRAAPAGRWA
jgi:3-oxoacyl-[acyl-carrier-protein] synthase-1